MIEGDDENNPMSVSETPAELGYTASYLSFYKNKFMIFEILLCLLWGFVSHDFTSALIPLNVRDVPYQQTQNGDIILDMYFNHKLVDQTISETFLVLSCMIMPLVICILAAIVLKSRPSDFHASVCAFAFAVGTTTFLTNWVKYYDGYLRPNFYEYCGFDEDSLECEEDKSEPHKSFPSGHSSLSFCGMTFLALFFYGKAGMHRAVGGNSVGSEQYDEGTLLKKRMLSFLSGLPLLWAIFVAASRVHDNYHHPADVVGGSILGLVCAWFSYHLWYPSLGSNVVGLPLQTVYELQRNECSQRVSTASGSTYA